MSPGCEESPELKLLLPEASSVAARASKMPREMGLSQRLQVWSAAAKSRKLNQGLPPLIYWECGEGIEGVFVCPSSDLALVLIVGCAIPWWGMYLSQKASAAEEKWLFLVNYVMNLLVGMVNSCIKATQGERSVA